MLNALWLAWVYGAGPGGIKNNWFLNNKALLTQLQRDSPEDSEANDMQTQPELRFLTALDNHQDQDRVSDLKLISPNERMQSSWPKHTIFGTFSEEHGLGTADKNLILFFIHLAFSPLGQDCWTSVDSTSRKGWRSSFSCLYHRALYLVTPWCLPP